MKTKWKPAKFDTGWKMTRECLFNGRPAIEGRPIKWWERIIWFDTILARRIRTGFWIIIICLFLSGCAKVDVITPDIEFHSFTVLKDLKIDPNSGVCSTTSNSAENIFAGLFGFLAGLWM